MADAKVPTKVPTKDTVTITLPRARDGEETEVFVGVNGQSWRIQRGKTVEVPACVAEVLRNAEMAEDANDIFLAENAYRTAEK